MTSFRPLVAWIFWVLVVQLGMVYSQEECFSQSSKTDSFLYNVQSSAPLTIEIRHNIKGSVVLRDAAFDGTDVEVEVQWQGASSEALDRRQTNHSMTDVDGRKVLMMQLDLPEFPVAMSMTSMIIGIVAGCLAVAVLITLAIWCIRRNRQQGELKVDEEEDSDLEEWGADPHRPPRKILETKVPQSGQQQRVHVIRRDEECTLLQSRPFRVSSIQEQDEEDEIQEEGEPICQRTLSETICDGDHSEPTSHRSDTSEENLSETALFLPGPSNPPAPDSPRPVRKEYGATKCASVRRYVTPPSSPCVHRQSIPVSSPTVPEHAVPRCHRGLCDGDHSDSEPVGSPCFERRQLSPPPSKNISTPTLSPSIISSDDTTSNYSTTTSEKSRATVALVPPSPRPPKPQTLTDSKFESPMGNPFMKTSTPKCPPSYSEISTQQYSPTSSKPPPPPPPPRSTKPADRPQTLPTSPSNSPWVTQRKGSQDSQSSQKSTPKQSPSPSQSQILPVTKPDKQWHPLPPIQTCAVDSICDGIHSEDERQQQTSAAEVDDTLPPPPKPHHVHPHGMSQGVMLSFTLVAVVSLVYAGCLVDPKVDVIIHIPKSVQIAGVNVFFKEIHSSLVSTNGWREHNKSKVKIYDVNNAKHTNNTSCDPKVACRAYKPLELVGCDTANRNCLCPRGYGMSWGTCDDLNECELGTHTCDADSTCVNTKGGYLCQCAEGFFNDGTGCRACSATCPDGQYEKIPCTENSNRVCAACTTCNATSYEVRPCKGGQNRKCVSVRNPYGVVGSRGVVYEEAWNNTDFFVQGSSNIFMENLHKTNSLETNVYVTQNNQFQHFYWIRESGLKINVKVDDIELIPEYEDVDHRSDNTYMNFSPDQHKKRKFADIVENYCRHPVPDYYNLSLEIYRSRTSAVTSIICDSTKYNRTRCPHHYRNGDTYYYRKVNEQCAHLGIRARSLQFTPNSIICTQETPLLTELFRRRMPQDKLIQNPHWECAAKSISCDTCLRASACGDYRQNVNQSCCASKCLSGKDCKSAFKSRCADLPVLCAEGDTMQYTIHPMFENITQRFHCHLKYKPKINLYKVKYKITIPSLYHGEEAEQVVQSKNGYHSQNYGQREMDYLTVTHNTKYALKDEFMLVGDVDTKSGEHNLAAHPFRDRSDFRSGRPPIYSFTDDIYTMAVQPERPFDISTMNWLNVQEGCWKNISNIHRRQRMYVQEGDQVNYTKQHDKRGGPYQYALAKKHNHPEIRVAIPGNRSVLYTYLKEYQARLLNDDTLKTQLVHDAEKMQWNLSVHGKFSGCPAYLSIIINDINAKEQLFHYDTMVVCPPKFHLNFTFYTFGSKNERTFEILLKDSQRNYTLYASTLDMQKEDSISSLAAQEDENILVVNGSLNKSILQRSVSSQVWWKAIRMAGIVFSSIVAFVLLLLALVECSRLDVSDTGDTTMNRSLRRKLELLRRQAQEVRKKGGLKLFMVAYGIFRLAYSICFTFTLFAFLLAQINHEDIIRLSNVNNISRITENFTQEILTRVDKHVETELLRQKRTVRDMRDACRVHLEGVFISFNKSVQDIHSKHMTLLQEHSNSVRAQTFDILRGRLEKLQGNINRHMKVYTENTEAKLEYLVNSYKLVLRDIYFNVWLSFPQLLYNSTPEVSSVQFPMDKSYSLDMPREQVNFLSFIGMDQGLDVQLVPYNWRKKLQQVPTVPIPYYHKWPQRSYNCSKDTSFHLVTDSASYTPTPYTSERVVQEVQIPSKLFNLTAVFDMLWTIFVGLDVIVFIFRLTRTVQTLKGLYKGFVERIPIGKSRSFYYNLCHVRCTHTPSGHESTYIDYKEDSLAGTPPFGTPREETIDSHKAMLSNLKGEKTHSKNLNRSHSSNCSKTSVFDCYSCLFKTVLQILFKLLSQNFIPKVSLVFAVIVCAYIMITACNMYVTAAIMNSLQEYDILQDGLLFHTRSANMFIQHHAEQWNTYSVEVFQHQMMTQLQGLAGFIDNFNADQTSFLANKSVSLCVVHNQTDCVPQVHATPLTVDLVPCHFVPVTPELLTGTELTLTGMLSSMIPEINVATQALANILYRSCYAILIAGGTMLVIHLFGVALFHYLKSRYKVAVRSVYEGTVPPLDVSVNISGVQPGELEEPLMINNIEQEHTHVRTLPHRHEESAV